MARAGALPRQLELGVLLPRPEGRDSYRLRRRITGRSQVTTLRETQRRIGTGFAGQQAFSISLRARFSISSTRSAYLALMLT